MSNAPANSNLFNYDANGAVMLSFFSATAFATLAGAKGASGLVDGQLVNVTADGSVWRYAKASTLTDDGLLVAAVTAGGALLRSDKCVDLILPFTFNTADAAVLYTVPTGFKLFIDNAFWEVTTSLTGGSSSAIGVNSSNAGLTANGSVLGGSSGDVAATLVSTGAFAKGTIGSGLNKPGSVIVGGETLKFQRITSAFTAGAGNVHVPVTLLATPAS